MDCREFRRRLTEWWPGPGTYPWRYETDPYRVLVAEMLLVRTRRDVATRVYVEFLRRFPDPCALRDASAEEVAAAVRPLGLAKRAAYLKNVGETLCGREFALELLEEIKGVGPYVAAAVKARLSLTCEIALDRNSGRPRRRHLLGRDPLQVSWRWIRPTCRSDRAVSTAAATRKR